MTTYARYFSTEELKVILAGWRGVEQEWQLLMAQMREAMDAGQAHDSLEIQPLVRRWMSLVHLALGGDFALVERWGEMYARETYAHGRKGAPAGDMIAFVRKAAQLRLDVMRRHLSEEDIRRVRPVPEASWREVEDEAARLMEAGHGAGSAPARSLAGRWLALFDQLCGGDPALRLKIWRAHAAEPLLAAGSALSPQVRSWLMASLDPHAT